jgi:hypothetical protein
MQSTAGLVPHVDPSTLLGRSAPALWRLLDADLNAYAVGDVVVDSLQSVAGYPVPRLVGGVALAGGGGQADRQRSLLSSMHNDFGVIVGVAPAAAFATSQSVIAAGGGSNRFVWVIPAQSHLFDIRGDAVAPARGEFVNGGAALNITIEGIARGGVTARLRYAPPTGAGSGMTLAGDSFNLTSDGELAVVGLAPGAALATGALYHVRLRFPKVFFLTPGPAVVDIGAM